jgi:beta-mannanase
MGKTGPQGYSGNANLEILKIVRLCLATALFAGGCGDSPVTATLKAPDPPSGPVHLIVPSEGAYTGAYIDFGDSEDQVTFEQIEAFEKAVGKHQAIIASSSYWGEQTFPLHNLEIIGRHHAIPLVYWSPWDKPYQQDLGPDRFSLSSVVAGKWDAYIDSWAAQAKAFGRPLFVAWGLEMNGTWFPWSGYFYGGGDELPGNRFAGPELFKNAYRRVVDRARAVGADNIIWVFHINNYSYPVDDWNDFKQYYPGDNYVDWLAMSTYGKQFRHDPWISAFDAMAYAYDDLCSINPEKPVMLAEWGIGEFPASGDKAAWIAEAFETMKKRFPRLKAAVYWNERWQNEDGTYSNLRVTSSQKALEAYRSGVHDEFWLDRPAYR